MYSIHVFRILSQGMYRSVETRSYFYTPRGFQGLHRGAKTRSYFYTPEVSKGCTVTQKLDPTFISRGLHGLSAIFKTITSLHLGSPPDLGGDTHLFRGFLGCCSFFFFCLCRFSCVLNVDCVSGMSKLDCHFGFL